MFSINDYYTINVRSKKKLSTKHHIADIDLKDFKRKFSYWTKRIIYFFVVHTSLPCNHSLL